MRSAYSLGSRAALIALLAALAPVGAFAEEAAAEAARSRNQALVGQLGDDSYRVRERAAAELLVGGLQTKAALLAGMKSEDLEIALRCRRLWRDVRINAGWERVRRLIGDSAQSRDLFDRMFNADPEVWYELVENPRAADVVFEDRRVRLQEQIKSRQAGEWAGAMATLLYFGIQARGENPGKELSRIDDLLGLDRSRQAFQSDEPLRALRDRWRTVSGTGEPAFESLMTTLRRREPQAVAIARDLLRDPRTPPRQRQYAVLALGNSQSAEDERLVADALEDSSPLDVLLTNGVVVRSELRDVALAVHIRRAGQDPEDFGFRHLRRSESTLFVPATLGFTDADERKAAFDKWSAFQAAGRMPASPDTQK